MKRQIRFGVFETNSSSTHTITICSGEDYDKFRNGELFYNNWDEKLITKEELIQMAEDNEYYNGSYDLESILNYYGSDNWILTYEDLMEDEYLYFYDHSFTTKYGEEVVAFGQYGNDY